MISVKNTTALRSLLRQWYRSSKKEYPWRGDGVTAYHILVAEYMLQQTQAARVAELLPPFLQTFPTTESLAVASSAHVIQSWRGLGYNNRAIRLRNAAKIIIEQHDGVIPRRPDVLKQLPGIGEYASNSLPCFIYGDRTVVVDVNVRRVYSRWLHHQADTSSLESMSVVRAFAQQIIPRTKADEWHHAVMDLGATICKARSANCSECPVSSACPSAGLPQAPYQTKKKNEPILRGKPRRLWRGLLVERLRDAGDKGLTIRELLPDKEALTSERSVWLELLNSLQADGIIKVSKRITLCD